MLLAVAPNKYSKACTPDGEWSPTYDVIDLEIALRRTYSSDAHCVGYVMNGLHAGDRQPRASKDSLAWLLSRGSLPFLHTVLVDVDNPSHSAWDDDSWQVMAEKLDSLPDGMGWYRTKNGVRIVQPLTVPIPANRAEGVIRAVCTIVEDEGLPPDWSAVDWTRHMRMPNVLRDGLPFVSLMDLGRMHPVTIAPLDGYDHEIGQQRTPRGPLNLAWREELPENWRPLVDELAWAMLEYKGEWHDAFMCLAGALLGRHVPPELVPTIIRSISVGTSIDQPQKRDERVSEARTTVERWIRSGRIKGYADLPDILRVALDRAMAPPAVRAVRSVDAHSLVHTTQAITDAIANAVPGVTVIQAECGTGKTQSAMRVAMSRADPNASWTPQKTGIVVPTHKLANQIHAQLGHRSLRVFSPTSHMTDGKPTCKYHAQALSLANGHQSVAWELCQGRGTTPCDVLMSCPAALGEEGTSDAKIIIGVHSHGASIADRVGKRGLLFVDEPPTKLEEIKITTEDIVHARAHAAHFGDRYTSVMLPILDAVDSWSVVDPFPHWSTDGAFKPDATRTNPPIRWASSKALRFDRRLADNIGRASRVFATLFRAMPRDSLVNVVRTPDGTVYFSFPPASLAAMLRHEGATVCADASPDIAVISRVTNYTPIIKRFAVSDGAPIERTWVHRRASRTHWFDRSGAPRIAEIVGAVRELRKWLNVHPLIGSVGIITVKPVADALRGLPEAHQGLREALAPLLPKGALVGHYGGVRGLDDMAACDAVATLGDPFPNMDANQRECEWLGHDDIQGRAEWKAEAELEQAHGRLRVVHRSKCGWALHVGKVRPGGSGWAIVNIMRTATNGRPAQEAAMTVEELSAIVDRFGGQQALSKKLGRSQSAVSRWLSGDVVISDTTARSLRSLCGNPL